MEKTFLYQFPPFQIYFAPSARIISNKARVKARASFYSIGIRF